MRDRIAKRIALTLAILDGAFWVWLIYGIHEQWYWLHWLAQ